MLKIGIDKTDKTFRHFEYDDERKYGNPLVYKVLYEESGSFGEILCSNVISIKQSTNTHNHFLDIPIYGETKPEVEVIKKETIIETPKVSEVVEEKKKSKSTKQKTTKKSVPLAGTVVEVNEPVIELSPTLHKSYEYDILIVDVSDVKEIKDRLNEFGHHGWEVCGFQTVQKMFGCQAIFIMKKGVN